MRLAVLTGFCFLLSLIVDAQNQARLDSLVRELQVAGDTNRVIILNSLATTLQYDAPDSALVHATRALKESEKLEYVHGIINAYNKIGTVYAIKTDYKQALDYFLKALEVSQAGGYAKLTGDALNNVANVYKFQDDYDNAIAYYYQALEIKRTLEDKSNELYALNSLGIALTEVKRFPEADSCFRQMIILADSLGNKTWAPKAYNQLARNFYFMYDYSSAIENFTIALNLERENGDLKRQAIALSNIGECYHYLKEYDKALDSYKESLAIREKINYKYGKVITLLQMAKSFYRKGALREATDHTHQSLSLARELGTRSKVVDALEGLAMLYAKQNDYERAYEYAQQLTVEKDSILTEQKTEQIAEMQARFDSEKKEQQIKSQQKEITLLEEKKAADRKLMFTLLSLAFVLLILAGFIYSRYRLKKRSEQTLKGKNEEIAIMNEELERKALRAQMDPHFIFNSLNSIQHFITANDKTSALKYLSKFSKLIRQILENSVNHQVLIADEIKLLEYYIQLEALRFDQKFEHQIDIDDNLDIHNMEIPFLLIQPYVENAIVHGLHNREEKGSLRVSLQDCEQHILCTVEDNGIGRQMAAQLKKQKQHISRGMSVTTRRLELLNRDKKNKTLVEVTDLYDQHQHVAGTKVEIKIPIDLN
ncbi:tetratricopeptide repeat protein [Fulvivirgaceae bacterium BMA10]|uniref:Tetratricopeptide repeat protein n=1 Tax=Splendidivirga corallicola TaxID=3051826 RepID=A0ABT8KPP1_9BACT|nr:tetratricopeptide repeat protein [Fulvivirgaceae bacterium BMA10]